MRSRTTPTSRERRLTYVGHSTVLIELDGRRILTDPVLGARIGPLRRQVPLPDPGVYADLDAVLISHLHFDHLDVKSLRQVGPGVPVIAPHGAAPVLKRSGLGQVVELGVNESTMIGDVTVAAVPAKHDGRRHPFGPRAAAIGFTATGSRRIYFAGDTELFAEMRLLSPGLDAALLPVWGWGPSLGAGHLNPSTAAEAVALLRPRLAVPVHWGTLFPFGLGRWHRDRLREPPHEFARCVTERAPEVEVRVLEPGRSTALE